MKFTVRLWTFSSWSQCLRYARGLPDSRWHRTNWTQSFRNVNRSLYWKALVICPKTTNAFSTLLSTSTPISRSWLTDIFILFTKVHNFTLFDILLQTLRWREVSAPISLTMMGCLLIIILICVIRKFNRNATFKCIFNLG